MSWLRTNIWYFVGLGLALVMLVVMGVTVYFGGMDEGDAKSVVSAGMSGEVHLRGVVSEGSRLVLAVREFYTERFDAVMDIDYQLGENAVWEWNGAESGQTYEVWVVLLRGEEVVTYSNTVSATAPASQISLVLGVTDGVASEQEATVSGVLELSGYIPESSMVSLWQRFEGEEEFVKVVDMTPEQGANWELSGLELGGVYEVRGQLDLGEKIVGQSGVLRVVAPASGEMLRMRSAVVPDRTVDKSATISGQIRLNGPVDEASTVVILQRRTGENDYAAVSRIPAVNGSGWSWSGAVASRSYEMTAVLQMAGENSSVGSMQTVVAPAVNKTFVIDTNLSFEPPLARPKVSCQEREDSGNWKAELELVKIEGAKNYWLSLGSSLGRADVVNDRVAASGDETQKLVVSVPEGEKRYARYAYGYCLNCLPTQNYSSFSPTLVFECPEKFPTPVVQGYRCDQVTNQCVETVEKRAEYAYTSTWLELCQAGCE